MSAWQRGPFMERFSTVLPIQRDNKWVALVGTLLARTARAGRSFLHVSTTACRRLPTAFMIVAETRAASRLGRTMCAFVLR